MYKYRGDFIKNTYVNNHHSECLEYSKKFQRITIVGCSRQPTKEQVQKNALGQISQVKEPQWDATLESAFIKRHQRGRLFLA